MAEYAIVLAGLAVVCLVAAVFVGAAIQGRFESTNTPTPANPFEPPPTRAVPAAELSDRDRGVRGRGLAKLPPVRQRS